MGSGSKSGGGGGGGGGGVQGTMPPETKKMVQSIKEIVSTFSESEIYGMLKECDMDPDTAVQRLLNLDTFHEVKSKRERRKETKETQDTRSWGNNTSSSYGVKGANERNLGLNATLLTSPNDYGNAAYKKENGSVSQILYSSSSASRTTGKTLYQQPSSQGDSFGADDGRHSTGTVDVISSSVQQHPRAQSAWSGAATGQVSMADIVKMGRPQNKASDIPRDVATSYPSDHCVKDTHILAPSQPDSCFPNPSYVPKRTNEFSNNADQHVHYDQWPAIEQPTTTTESSALDVSTVLDADVSTNQANMSRNCLLRDVQVSNGDVGREDLRFDFTKTSVSSRQNSVNRPGAAGHMYGRLEGNGSDIPSRSPFMPKADDNIITVSSAAEELEHLSLGKEDHVKSPTVDNCTVVFPNNLQALAGDCSHLSFGTYKSSNDAAFSGPPTLDPLEKNMGAVSAAMHAPSTGGLDTRYFGYDADAQTESYSTHKMTADAGIYDLPVSTQPELMKENVYEANYGREYIDPLSVPDSSFESISQSSTFPFSEADRTVRNQPSLPNEVLAYLASQQLPSRYGGSVSSIGSPTISMAEVTKSGAFSPQQSSQTLPGAMGPGLQQHLTAHQYPQRSLNVEQLANIIGYPSALSQSQYKPYAQESYPGGNSYQSLADMKYGLQHYKSGASLSNLPVSNANASAYASLGNFTNIPGSFLHNPSVGPTATNTGGYDLFLSQYKDANHFNPTLRQNDSSSGDYAAGSRTMSSVPGNAYYSLQAQNQQHLGYRQNQQASQHYAALGYPDLYHSQTGMPQEFQRQSLGDPAVYSQIASSKQQQLWQQRY